MPKRPLSVRNQEESEPASTRTTRSTSKRSKTTDSTASKEEKQENKENDSEEAVDEQMVSNEGQVHPKNKQYLVYKSANKEDYIISKTARYWNIKYRKDLYHVCPDFYGMYIYNDFTGYGQLEVIENCLLDLTKTIFLTQQVGLYRERKALDDINYVLAYRRLEALTIILDCTDEFTNIDDGERYLAILRVIGACYVTILHGLLPQIMFEKLETFDEMLVKKLKKLARQIPNFQQVLERSIIVGHRLLTIGDTCSAYTKVLQIVYSNWLLIMQDLSLDLDRPANEDKQALWAALKHASNVDPDHLEEGEKESFDFLRELRLYAEEYGLGGDTHDLRKWSRAEREQYSLDRFRRFWF